MTDTPRADAGHRRRSPCCAEEARRYLETEADAGSRDEALDVERLGKAMVATGFWPRGYQAMLRKWPAMVAAEYAALAKASE